MKLPKKQIKTVALETGIQNVGVAFLIIYTNLPSPKADYAAFPIIAIAFMTPAPLYTIYFISRCVLCARKRRDDKKPKSIEKKAAEKAVQSVDEDDKSSASGLEMAPLKNPTPETA